MAKVVLKIADLAQLKRPVDISEDHQIMVRALNLREMIGLFMDSREVFIPLYAAGIEGKVDVKHLAPFLLSAPDVVAKIISLASDEPEFATNIDKYMSGTVQLIALGEIWKASVPDPKKAKELLSEVTTLLQTLSEKVGLENQKISSQMISQPQ